MALSLVRMGGSAGLGAINIVTQLVDNKQKYTKPFENITDWARVAGFAGGAFGAWYMDKNDMVGDVLEGVELGSLPLLEESVYKLIQAHVGSLPQLPSLGRGYTLKRTNNAGGQPRQPAAVQPGQPIPPRTQPGAGQLFG